MKLDEVNAAFELVGACMRVYDCYVLFKAKRFIGGSLWTAAFFFGWGLFNTVFYPSLNQTWSFVAALALTAVNGAWIAMALYYRTKHDKETCR